MSTKFLMRSLFLTTILFGSITCALAQQQADVVAKPAISPEKRALIAELLEVTDTKKTAAAVFNSVLDQDEKEMPNFVWQGVLASKAVQELDAAAQEDLRQTLLAESNRMSKRIRELFAERIDFTRIVEDISTDLYDKYFTEAEVKDLIIFYKSSTGKKTIDVMPKMFTESMSNTMEAIKPKVMEIVTALVNEEAERVKKDLSAKKSSEPAKPQPRRRRGKP
jgi:hypothetical protein